jgi:hypothetical protein
MQSGARLPLSRRCVRQDSLQWWRKVALGWSCYGNVLLVTGPSRVRVRPRESRAAQCVWSRLRGPVRFRGGQSRCLRWFGRRPGRGGGHGGHEGHDTRKHMRCLLAALMGVGPSSHVLNPQSLAEALARPDGEQWAHAVSEKVGSLLAFDVWDACDLPEGKRPFRVTSCSTQSEMGGTRFGLWQGAIAKRQRWTTGRRMPQSARTECCACMRIVHMMPAVAAREGLILRYVSTAQCGVRGGRVNLPTCRNREPCRG